MTDPFVPWIDAVFSVDIFQGIISFSRSTQPFRRSLKGPCLWITAASSAEFVRRILSFPGLTPLRGSNLFKTSFLSLDERRFSDKCIQGILAFLRFAPHFRPICSMDPFGRWTNNAVGVELIQGILTFPGLTQSFFGQVCSLRPLD